MASISLDIGEIASREIRVSVRFQGVTRFRLRLKLAAAIMRLAGWISPVPVAVEFDHEART